MMLMLRLVEAARLGLAANVHLGGLVFTQPHAQHRGGG